MNNRTKKLIVSSLYRVVVVIVILGMLMAPGGKSSVVTAASGLDYDLTRLWFEPGSPKMGSTVTPYVLVTNAGTGITPPTSVMLSWCCGDISRDITALNPGESVTVKFDHSLVYNEPGEYEITVKVDPANDLAEEDETNNSKTEVVRVLLTEPQPPASGSTPANWGDATDRLECPDSPLMAIGRKVPLVYEDIDSDGTPDRLSREVDGCHRDDPDTDAGCQVYVRGQKVNACGTTSLARVLNYFGRNVSPDDIDDRIRSSSFEMFSEPIGLKDFAESSGLNAEVYIGGDLEEVRALVHRGIPVMLDISSIANSTDVNNGHWVVVISFCELPADYPPGATRTVIGIYDPNGKQFGISPEDLNLFWGTMELEGIRLWDKLYIAVSTADLPPGNTDEVMTQLALARAVSMFMTGASDTFMEAFYEGDVSRLLEGVIEMAGGVVTGLGALLCQVIAWGDDLPLIGSAMGAIAEVGGELTMATADIFESIADFTTALFTLDFEAMGRAILGIVEAVVDAVVAVFEFIWDIILAIGDFFVAIWDGLVELGCDWFGIGCPVTVVYYKHFVSADPCLETRTFISDYRRIQPFGYLYTSPVPDSKPVWLYASALSDTPLDFMEGDGLAVGDLDGDGTDELVHGDADRRVISAYDISGNRLGEYAGFNYPSKELRCADVNGDSRDEIIEYKPHPATLKIYSGGTRLAELRLSAWTLKGLVTGDINGDGNEEIIWADESSVNIIDIDGRSLSSFATVPEGSEGIPSSAWTTVSGYKGELLGVGNIDGSAGDRIILGVERRSYLGRYDYWIASVDINGRNPLFYGSTGSDSLADGQISLGDVDGDGKDDIIQHLESYPAGYTIYTVVDGNLVLLGSLKKSLARGDMLLNSDLNGDGKDEIILGDSFGGVLFFTMSSIDTAKSPPELKGYWTQLGGLPQFSLRDVGDWNLTDTSQINLGLLGYALINDPGDGYDFTAYAMDKGLDAGDDLGYLLGSPETGTTLLWLMQRLADGAFAVAADACDGTYTFVGNVAKGYTRELPVCFISQSETGSAQKLYRAYNTSSEDCFLSLDPEYGDIPRDGEYQRQGYLGFIYNSEQPGTVPLYQFYNSARKDHFVTTDPDAEGLIGYSGRQLLGYVTSVSASEPELFTCKVPLWRFCKRVQKEE